jgi:hypothetical protein
MKKHIVFLVVAASVMLALSPAEARSASLSHNPACLEDIGPNVITQLKPTVPPNAPRRFERLPLLAGVLTGSGLIISIPQDAGDTDVTLTDTGTGSCTTTTLAPGVHLIPFSPSGEPLLLRAVTEQGVCYEGVLDN